MLVDDVAQILRRLRARDAEELREYGHDLSPEALTEEGPLNAARAFVDNRVLGRCFKHEGVPVAVAAFHALTPRALVVSLVATDDWRRVARALVRWGVREAKPELLERGYERAECRTMDGHADAIRLLEHLGFKPECRIERYGATAKAFIQFAWRLNDHAPERD